MDQSEFSNYSSKQAVSFFEQNSTKQKKTFLIFTFSKQKNISFTINLNIWFFKKNLIFDFL